MGNTIPNPSSELNADTSRATSTKAIWNPNAAANWSFLFTPAFGSYLQMLNWKTLGEPGKAAAAKVWFYVSLVVLTACIAINVVAARQGASGGAANGLAFLYLLVWYFAAGRKQTKYIKENLASAYPRRSWIKPVLIGVVALAGYTAIAAAATVVVIGQMKSQLVKADEAPSEKSDDSKSTTTQASEPEPTRETLAAAAAAAATLDCAAADVKEAITSNYAEQLVGSGVPDLIFAIARERIKFGVQMITETKRDETTGNLKCSGQLVLEFPKEDLDRAAQADEAKIAQLTVQNFKVPTDPVFKAMLTYTVSNPADKEEQKNGPIVQMTMTKGEVDGERLGQFIASYTMLTYSTPDITTTTRNEKKWDKEFKEASIQECSKQLSVEICKCRMNQFEQVLTQEDLHRIGYSISTNPLLANKYTNFNELAESLNKQCPAAKNADSVATSQ